MNGWLRIPGHIISCEWLFDLMIEAVDITQRPDLVHLTAGSTGVPRSPNVMILKLSCWLRWISMVDAGMGSTPGISPDDSPWIRDPRF